MPRVAEVTPVEKDSSVGRSFKGLTVTVILARSGECCIYFPKLVVEGAKEKLFSPDYEGWLNRVENLKVETQGESRRAAVLGAAKIAPSTPGRAARIGLSKRQRLRKDQPG